MENFRFFLTCLGVFAAILIVAAVFEKLFYKSRKAFLSTHYISYTAVFACMAGVLMCIEIPLFFAPSFYKLDLSELPVLICTFYLGPVSGVICELLKVMIKLLLKGTSTAFVGDFANFAVGCSFIVPASFVYHSKPGKNSAIIGMITGTIIMSVFGSAFNALYLIPKFAQLFKIPLDVIIGMGTAVNKHIIDVPTLVLFAVVPFNVLKGLTVSLLTALLYKRISPILHKGDAKKKERNSKNQEAPV